MAGFYLSIDMEALTLHSHFVLKFGLYNLFYVNMEYSLIVMCHHDAFWHHVHSLVFFGTYHCVFLTWSSLWNISLWKETYNVKPLDSRIKAPNSWLAVSQVQLLLDANRKIEYAHLLWMQTTFLSGTCSSTYTIVVSRSLL